MNYGHAVDYQPQRYVLCGQSIWFPAVRRKSQSNHSVVVFVVVVDMYGLVRGMRERVPFQEKPTRVAAVQYADEGML